MYYEINEEGVELGSLFDRRDHTILPFNAINFENVKQDTKQTFALNDLNFQIEQVDLSTNEFETSNATMEGNLNFGIVLSIGIVRPEGRIKFRRANTQKNDKNEKILRISYLDKKIQEKLIFKNCEKFVSYDTIKKHDPTHFVSGITYGVKCIIDIHINVLEQLNEKDNGFNYLMSFYTSLIEAKNSINIEDLKKISNKFSFIKAVLKSNLPDHLINNCLTSFQDAYNYINEIKEVVARKSPDKGWPIYAKLDEINLLPGVEINPEFTPFSYETILRIEKFNDNLNKENEKLKKIKSIVQYSQNKDFKFRQENNLVSRQEARNKDNLDKASKETRYNNKNSSSLDEVLNECETFIEQVLMPHVGKWDLISKVVMLQRNISALKQNVNTKSERRDFFFHELKYDFFEGELLNKKIMHGIGTLYYKNKDKYIGHFKNDKKNGIGIFYKNNGERFEGYWEDDKKNGVGILYKKDGSEDEGIWKEDVKTKSIEY